MGSASALGLLAVLLVVRNVAATQFKVGGAAGWSVPPGNNAVYNQWAEKMRFQVGDSLLFVYPSGDSVLRVTKDDYANCNTAAPLEKHTDGHTVVTLSQSGPHYFISGNKDDCNRNEKLLVVVLADRTKRAESATPPAPSTEASPAPAPATEQTPEPQAPSTESPPHNGASSVAKGIVASVGVVGAALLAAL